MKRQLSCVDGPAVTRAVGRACLLAVVLVADIGVAAGEELFVSKRISPVKEYTGGIEGPAVSAAGDLYVTNLRRPGPDPDKKGAIGILKLGASQSQPFAILPDNGIGNGIRFGGDGKMYVADYINHKIHVFDSGSNVPREYFHADFHQPNDLAIARDGTLYASDPKARERIGRIWRIARDPDGIVRGAVMSSPRAMGITNGIDLSPDHTTLYVSESQFTHQGEHRRASIWAYRIDGAALVDPRPVFEFPKGDVDGLRVDTDGKIFVARPSFGAVAIVTPDGRQVREVKTLGLDPTNLTFGGADGRDVFVTQAEQSKRFIERFRADRPGREPCLKSSTPACTPVAP
jgi:sugar lactone lactonase YvrE